MQQRGTFAIAIVTYREEVCVAMDCRYGVKCWSVRNVRHLFQRLTNTAIGELRKLVKWGIPTARTFCDVTPVVWYACTDVSKEPPASIMMAVTCSFVKSVLLIVRRLIANVGSSLLINVVVRQM